MLFDINQVQRSSLKATLANAKAAAAGHQVDELAKTGVNGQQGSGKGWLSICSR